MEDENYDDLEDVDELSSHLAKGLNSSHVLYLLRFFVWLDYPKNPKRASKLSAMQLLEKKLEKKLILRKWS